MCKCASKGHKHTAHNPGDRTTHGPSPREGSRVNTAPLCAANRRGQARTLSDTTQRNQSPQSLPDTQTHLVEITHAQHNNGTSLAQSQRPRNPAQRTSPASRSQTNNSRHNDEHAESPRRAQVHAPKQRRHLPAPTPRPSAETTALGRSRPCPPLTRALAQSHRMHTTAGKK